MTTNYTILNLSRLHKTKMMFMRNFIYYYAKIFSKVPNNLEGYSLLKSIRIKTNFAIWSRSFCLSHFRVIDPMIWYLHLLWTLNVRWYKNISVEYFITWTPTLSNLSFYRIYANHYSPSFKTHVFHSLENGSNIFVFPPSNIFWNLNWSHPHSEE